MEIERTTGTKRMNDASSLRITFLVLAHHLPEQFGRLLQCLAADECTIVAHIDAKSDIMAFRQAVTSIERRVAFVTDRHSVRWGDFSMVSAELTLLRYAREHRPADYYILLSGSDFPVKPIDALKRELSSGAIYINSWPMPSREKGKPLDRLEYFFFALEDRDNRFGILLNEVVLKMLPKRKVDAGLGGRKPYGGSQWWAFPHEVAVDVLDFVDTEREFVKFFRRSKIPDEMFFQTIVEARQDRGLVRPALTYADWTPQLGGLPAPAVLGKAHAEILTSIPEFFARKFDQRVDASILDYLEAIVGYPRLPDY